MKEKLRNIKKGNSGITLIALIITIIVLIILAGITINLLMGDNGILTRAKGAKEEFNKTKMLEDFSLILMDYSAEHELTGITLENYLTKNNISFEEDGDGNILFEEEGYILTVNPITLELDGPTKSNKTAKIGLSSNGINPGDTLKVTLTFGEDVDVANCKYKFAKASETVEKEDVTTAVTGTTVNIPSSETVQKGEYYFYLLVAYKDNTESVLKKAKVTVGVPVTGVTLNKTSLNLFVGDATNNEPLVANVEPSNAVQGVDWSSSDTSIATVNNSGVVTAVSGGTATITATSIDDTSKAATCTVTVETLDSIAITTSQTRTEYDQGENFELAGMVVTATYISGNTRTVTSSVTATPTTLTTAGNNIPVTISYTEGSVAKTATTVVTVVPVYTWIKYSTTTGKIWEYYLDTRYTVLSLTTGEKNSWKHLKINDLEDFNKVNGTWYSNETVFGKDFVAGGIYSFKKDPSWTEGSCDFVFVYSGNENEIRTNEFNMEGVFYRARQVDGYVKGTTNYGTVTSRNENAYPANGYQEEDGVMYWYEKNN